METTTELPVGERVCVSRARAAEALDVSIDTIDNMADAGRLERVKLSSKKVGITWRSILKLVGREAA